MSAVANGLLSTDFPPMPNLSPSLSSISTNSDDAFQLSFEYIFDDQGNAVRISKNPNSEEKQQKLFFATQEEGFAPSTRLNELLGNEHTSENPQSIASVLSRSYGSLGTQSSNVVSDGAHRSFQRAVSGSAVPMASSRPSLLENDRPSGRARRIPIDGKRKEDVDLLKRERDDEDREKEARLRRIREKDKENWMLGSEAVANDHISSASLVSSIARTLSDPFPSLATADHADHQPHSQPLEPVQVHVRSRRPLSKQQRVLGAVPRPKESFGIRSSAGSSDARSTPGSIEASPENESKPIRPIAGGAKRVTKEDRETQEQEAVELQEQLEREEKQHEMQRIAEEREQDIQRRSDEPQEIVHDARSQSSLSFFAKDQEHHHYPGVQIEKEREREPNKMIRAAHQRRDSETVMPESLPVPARLSPSARNVPTASSFERNQALNPQPVERPVERAQGLQRTSSMGQSSQAMSRGLHRRSPTAPEPHNVPNGNHVAPIPNHGKGKTWAVGADVIGDVDKDLGGLGPSIEGSAREKEARETRPPPVPSAPIQITGAKAFQVNGRTYGKLDMIGKGGSSRVYRVITPTNEIYALKRVSLDRTDQETMQGYMNEIALLRRLDGNDRIIRLIESEVKGGSKGHLMLVMECGEVDLARLIAARQSIPLDMVWVAYYWKQMLEAVHVIHEEKIVHSDLKPANFVLVKGDLKLIDFGIANAIANDTTNIQRDHQIGTVNYMSPESIEVAEGNARLKVGRASDIWSLGCILYQMVYGFPPFHQLSVLQKMRVIPDPNNVIDFPVDAVPIVPQPKNASASNGAGSTPPKKLYHLARPVPLEVIETLRSCLMKNPKDRETIPQLLAAGWLHPKGRSGELNLSPDEVIIDRDLLRQVVTWAFSVGQNSGVPPEETLEETLSQTLLQLQQCTRKR